MIEIDQNVLQAIANYLSTKPYSEVVGMITAIQGCKVVPEKPEEPETED